MSAFPCIPSVQITLPAVVAPETVATRTWVLRMPAQPFDPVGFEVLVGAYMARGQGCEWPLGEPGTPGFSFCGDARIPGRSHYCQRHAVRGRYRGKRGAQHVTR